jgi:hypothetical protein
VTLELFREIEGILIDFHDEFRRRCKAELERFGRALQRWFAQVLPKTAPENIERELYRFLTVWDREGFHVEPNSYLELVDWLKAWAEHNGGLNFVDRPVVHAYAAPPQTAPSTATTPPSSATIPPQTPTGSTTVTPPPVPRRRINRPSQS